MIGLMAGTVGTSISNGLLALRKQLDPNFVTQNEPPSVVGNAACWALHMGISSNLRYQLLGGADGVSDRVQRPRELRDVRGLQQSCFCVSPVPSLQGFGGMRVPEFACIHSSCIHPPACQ